MNADVIVSKLTGVVVRNGEYVAYCPSCEGQKTGGDRHLYLRAENERILLDCKKGCTVDAVCAALGIGVADLFEKKASRAWDLLREHLYHDPNGIVTAKKAIYRKPDGEKSCVWYRYESGRYIKGLGGYKPPMYNLPAFIKSKQPVYIVEGEKDADTLGAMGYLATTTPNGAGAAKIPDECLGYFRDREVVIMGDNDEPGRKYAEIIYNTLRKTSSTVRLDPVVLWDRLPEKGDISDVYQALGADETRRRLEEAISGARGEDLYKRSYIYIDERGHEKVSAPCLYAYIRDHERYLFARSDTKGSVQRYIYRGGVYRHISNDEFKGVIRGYLPLPLQSARTITEVYSLFTMDGDRFIPIDSLDADENIINFTNGILRLDTMELAPHSPEFLSSIQLPVDYNPRAPRPRESVFERFIGHLTEGHADRRRLILEFMGVTLSNVAGYRMKKALFMYGAGNTGKSQCKELLVRLLGSNLFAATELDTLEERFGTAQLYGKRLAGSSDMGYVTVKGLRVIKLLTGGDSVFAEFKGENSFNYRYRGVIWFCSNRLPRFGGDKGDHVYDRMIILPCNNTVAEPDPLLLDKMLKESDYILRICIGAVKELVDRGYKYTEPECSRAEMKAYRVENNSILKFLEECTEARPPGDKYNDPFTTGWLYKTYKRWSDANNGKFHEDRDVFINTIKDRGITERLLDGRTFYSIMPTPETVKEYNLCDRY